jgi:hypothetical protein
MIITIILTTIVYLVLQRIDENRREKNNEPPASIGSRIGLLFFVAIVCFIGVYLMENMNSEPKNTAVFVEGGKYETDMLKTIHEPIHTGLPPF